MPIVQAVGVCAASLKPQNKELSQRREKAMSDAVQQASDEGLSVASTLMKDRILEAYRKVK